MDGVRRRVAEQVLAAARTHDLSQPDRLSRFRNVEPETAELLHLLVRATQAKRILELGTSNGYSTIWLADAAESVGATVTSVEIDPRRTALARENLTRAGLHVALRTQDAGDALRGSGDRTWDLIFLDAERDAYVGYWADLLRSLRPAGGLLAIDNVVSHADEVAAVTELILAEPSVTTALVPIGAGLRLVVRV